MSVTFPGKIAATRWLYCAFVGAIAGSVLVSLCYALGVTQLNGAHYYFEHGIPPTVTMFLFAFVFWFLGLFVIAIPLWCLLRKSARKRWVTASAMGALLTFAVTLAISTSVFGLIQRQPDAVYSVTGPGGPIILDSNRSAWAMAFQESLFLGFEGALVGLFVWRRAYRRRLGVELS